MIEVPKKLRNADLPFTIHYKGVTEEMFDELADEDTRAELIDGVMVVPSPASLRHDDVSGFMRTLVRRFANKIKAGRALGPDSMVHLAICRKFCPDVYFIRKDRVPVPLPEKQFEGAPDLVIEVLSPSNKDEDLEDKRPAYQEAGVGEIWLIDPDEQTVMVDRKRRRKYATATASKGRIASDVLPGFWVEAEWLWQDPLPDDDECFDRIVRG